MLEKTTDQEINEAVARKLGWKCASQYVWTDPAGSFRINPKDYCHDIKAAFDIVESYNLFRISRYGLDWEAELNTTGAIAKTAPMAICLAFLKLP